MFSAQQQLLLPSAPFLFLQKAYAVSYTVSDEASCLALPSGSPSWDSSSNTCEIDGALTIANGDTLTISSETILEVTSSGTITNLGTISNNFGGLITNLGTISNNFGGTINNNGGGTISNFGTISNNGGTINNNGGISNHFGGFINNPNGGTINNRSTIYNGGTINNTGTIKNLGTIDNDGTINNRSTGTIDNNGTIKNFGLIFNVNGGTINNFGTIDNNSSIDNSGGTIINKCGGTISVGGISGNPVQNEPCTPTDTTPPTITITGNINEDDSFYFGEVPAEPTCTAVDEEGGSGLDGACVITGYSTEVGTHTITATAKDKAGNTATQEIHYTVLAWEIRGFYSPVDMNDVVNTVKSGQTVSLKFEVFAGENEKTSTDVVDSFTRQKISCSSLADEPVDTVEVTTTGGTQLRYDESGAGQFVQNWKTPSNSANTCWEITLTTDDGSSISALFKLTR